MEPGRTRLRETAWVAAGLHIAGLPGLLLLRPGLPREPLAERTAWLASFPLPWSLGWGIWMLSALALVGFVLSLSWRLSGIASLRWPIALVMIGAAIDLSCEALYISLLPVLAGQSPGDFLVLERSLYLGGLVFANGAYTVAVLSITLRLRAHRLTGRASSVLGSSTAALGGLVALAGVLDELLLAGAASVPMILALSLWLLSVARDLGPGPARERARRRA